MEAAVIAALLNTWLPKLWNEIKVERELGRGIQQDIDVIINNLLPLMAARIRQHELQCMATYWEPTHVINRARHLAQYTEDCICRFLYRTQRVSQRVSHASFAAKVKELKEDLKKLIPELSSLGPGSITSFPETKDPHFGKEDLVGMDVARKELCELLRSESKGKLKVISIVGFGGSGKTRLAQKVCEDVVKEFDQQAWVCLAKRNAEEVLEAHLEEMMKKASASHSSGVVPTPAFSASTMASVPPPASSDVQHVDNGAGASVGVQHVDNGANASTSFKERLKSFLGKQRYLIVIDDVRKEKDWFTLEELFPDNDVGSRIIVTTTNQSVAARCSFYNGHVYKMSTLCGGDSNKLFLNALRSSAKMDEEMSPLINICDGLPLALIESAESLKGKAVDKSGCQKAVRRLCAIVEGNNSTLGRMQWVLMNKYTGLTSYAARSCLLYFHMFPSRNPTKRKFILRRWLAEEFVERAQPGFSELDAASEHLKTLSEFNIIRDMEISNNATVKSCRLHGTMYEFISRQSNSQNFVTFLCHGTNEPTEPNNVRRLSLRDGTAISEACIKDVPVYLLRTLAVSGEACTAVMDFSKYKLLRVLDLKECDYQLDKTILEAICKLKMLKYLGLPGSIGQVPRKISELEDLETLDVGGTKIVELCGNVIRHRKLKHLLGKFCLNAKDRAENWVPQDSTLETFSGFVNNGKAAFPKLMKHMRRLRKVKMWYNSKEDEGEVEHLSAAIKEFIRERITESGDRSLSIDVTGGEAPFLNSLEADPNRLTKLKLHGLIKIWPKFITRLKGVRELCLSSTTQSRSFLASLAPGTDTFTSLRYLKLVEDELGPLDILKNNFPGLRGICLVGNNSINPITVEAGALQRLVSLHVICEHLDGLAGIKIKGLKELKEIALHSKVSQTTGDVHPEIKSTKDIWKDAARRHPNKPQVLLIEAAP